MNAVDRLVIAHGNVHNRLAPALYLTRRNADSIGLNEAQRLVPKLRRRRHGGYDVIAADPVWDPRSAETPILARRGLRPLGQLAMKISRESDPERVAPERWVTVNMFDHPGIGPVAHTNVHFHWIGPAHDRPQVDRVQAYDEGARQLRKLLTWQKRAGFARVCSGDVNIPRRTTSPGWLTAWEVFEAAGMTSRGQGLDAIAWDPDALHLISLDVIDRDTFGSDHPALIGRFRKARR